MNITIYVREDCHLCAQVLSYLQLKKNLIIEIIDIDSDVQLQKKFGEIIPVVVIEEKIMHAPIDFIELEKQITA
jgi:glutaredoxin